MESRRDTFKANKFANNFAKQRREQSQALSQQRREAILKAKRFRHDAETFSDGGVDGLSHQQLQQLLTSARSALPRGLAAALLPLRELRRAVSKGQQASEEAVAGGALPVLADACRLRTSKAVDVEAQVEACWALTNLAACGAHVHGATLVAAPALIGLLGASSAPVVAEQASWALGNLAADGPEAAGQLERLGAVQALAALMWRGADPLEGVPGTRAATQAAWAVSNLARYAPSKVASLILGSRESPALLRLLRAAESAPDMAAEVAWLLCTLAAAAVPSVRVPQDVLSAASHLLLSVMNQLPGEAPPYLPPLVRLMGHVAGAAGSAMGSAMESARGSAMGDATGSAMDWDMTSTKVSTMKSTMESPAGCAVDIGMGYIGGSAKGSVVASAVGAVEGRSNVQQSALAEAVPALLRCATAQHPVGLRLEALWAIGNIAGMSIRWGPELLLVSGAVPVLVQALDDAPAFQEMALFALANLAAGGAGGTGDSEMIDRMLDGTPDLVLRVVGTLGSPDPSVRTLALQLAEIVGRVSAKAHASPLPPHHSLLLQRLRFGADEMQRAMAAVVSSSFLQ